MSAFLLCGLAWFSTASATKSGHICDGNFGPDFVNVSAVINEFVKRQLISDVLGNYAGRLTLIQEDLLGFICASGFAVSDNCGMHRPEDAQKVQSLRCNGGSGDGLGHIHTIYTGPDLVDMIDSSTSCCAESAWEHLSQLVSDFLSQDMSSAVGQPLWDTLLEQTHAILKRDELVSSQWVGPLESKDVSTHQDLGGDLPEVIKLARQAKDKNVSTAQDVTDVLMMYCWGCFSAYEVMRLIAGWAKILVWGYMYEYAKRLGQIELIDWTYEPWRGVHHVAVVHTLLKELEVISDLWVSPDGKAAAEFRAVEVGVYQGASSLRWLKWQPSLKMLVVDPYTHVFASGDKYTDMLGTDPDDDLRLLRRGMSPYVQANRASILVAPSVLAASWIQDNSVALVFIDGDHTASAVAEDVLAWIPKVRPGGIIAGHDYHPFESWGSEAGPSVAAGVQRTLPPGRQLHLSVEGVWWWFVHAGDAQTLRPV